MMAAGNCVARSVEGLDVIYLDILFAPTGCARVLVSPTSCSSSKPPDMVLLKNKLAFVGAPGGSFSREFHATPATVQVLPRPWGQFAGDNYSVCLSHLSVAAGFETLVDQPTRQLGGHMNVPCSVWLLQTQISRLRGILRLLSVGSCHYTPGIGTRAAKGTCERV